MKHDSYNLLKLIKRVEAANNMANSEDISTINLLEMVLQIFNLIPILANEGGCLIILSRINTNMKCSFNISV